MTFTREPEVVSFDVDAVVDAVMETVDGEVLSVTEFTHETFNPVFVSEEAMAVYEDEEQMLDHFERIHDYVNLDFTEQELFTEELLPTENRVTFIATGLENFTMLRYYRDDEGLTIAVEHGVPVQPIVDAIEGVVD